MDDWSLAYEMQAVETETDDEPDVEAVERTLRLVERASDAGSAELIRAYHMCARAELRLRSIRTRLLELHARAQRETLP